MQRPLEILPAPQVNPEIDDPISAICESSEFAAAKDYFSEYPEFSLLTNAPLSRAFIYMLIRSLGLRTALEIGTYRAGTSEIIARAIWANGNGHMDTVDPYGAMMVPPALAEWSDELRALCTYHQMTSMEFFNRAVLDGKKYDFIFVDGDHDYEAALFDIQRSATFLRHGGIILIDNANLPSVRGAALRFLREAPEWTLLGRDRKEAMAQPPIVKNSDAKMSLPDTELWCLRAPWFMSVTDRLVVFPNLRFSGVSLYALRLILSPSARWPAAGVLSIMAYWRALPLFGGMEGEGLAVTQFETMEEVDVATLVPKAGEVIVPFTSPIVVNLPRLDEYLRFVECSMFFANAPSSHERLELSARPEFLDFLPSSHD